MLELSYLSGQHRSPQFRPGSGWAAQFPPLKLCLLDFLHEFDATARYGRVIEPLTCQDRVAALFDAPAVLFDPITKIFAGTHWNTLWQSAFCFQLPPRSMQGGLGIERDHARYTRMLNRLASKDFGRTYVPFHAEIKIHCLPQRIHGSLEVGPTSFHFDVGLILSPENVSFP